MMWLCCISALLHDRIIILLYCWINVPLFYCIALSNNGVVHSSSKNDVEFFRCHQRKSGAH